MRLSKLSLAIASISVCFAYVSHERLPTVVWHGLGDSADSEGILAVLELIANHTGGPAFAISTGPRDSSFFGNVNAQLEQVSKDLKSNLALSSGFNAIGFSQGGQFLRAYVERYNDPAVGSLMTWGSQHSGISEVPCSSEESAVCKSTRFLVHNNAFSSFVQNRVVPAQYYKGSTDSMQQYLDHSIFLPDINNERQVKNSSYASNLNTLDSFIMIQFTNDRTVIPKQSSLFQDVKEGGDTVPIEQTTYWRDLGLKRMNETGKLFSHVVEGEHMQIDHDQLLNFIDMYFVKQVHRDDNSVKKLPSVGHDFL